MLSFSKKESISNSEQSLFRHLWLDPANSLFASSWHRHFFKEKSFFWQRVTHTDPEHQQPNRCSWMIKCPHNWGLTLWSRDYVKIAQAMPAYSCKTSQAHGNKDHLANAAQRANRALLGVGWENFHWPWSDPVLPAEPKGCRAGESGGKHSYRLCRGLHPKPSSTRDEPATLWQAITSSLKQTLCWPELT